MDIDKIYNEDCLEGMKHIPSASIDMILCDLPYGTTARNEWDKIIPFEPLWEQYKRIIKKNGAICLWAQIPFSIKLGASNLSMLRYEWIVEKTMATGFLNANRMPLKAHESVLVFYDGLPTYNPQKTIAETSYVRRQGDCSSKNYNALSPDKRSYGFERYPRDCIKVSNGWKRSKLKFHPTQKLVSACEYFIKTYTNEGETVLDNCMGSGTTAVACINTNRHYIGFELEKQYYDIACKRIANAKAEKESKFAFS